MPGRIRTLKPELLEDSKAAGLSHEAWRLFVSALLLSDDYGVLRGEPGYLLGQVFWKHRGVDVAAATAELIRAGLWTTYMVGDQQYIHVTGWDRHQKVKNPSKFRLPQPSCGEYTETLRRLYGDSTETVTPDHRPSTIDHDRSTTSSSQQQSRRKPTTPDPAPEALELAQTLVDAIAKRLPQSRPAQEAEQSARRWAVDIDRLHRLDSRPWGRIREVLDWSQRDPFWQTNILSGKKLREQFDTLEAKMDAPPRQQAPARRSGMNAQDLWEYANQLEAEGK